MGSRWNEKQLCTSAAFERTLSMILTTIQKNKTKRKKKSTHNYFTWDYHDCILANRSRICKLLPSMMMRDKIKKLKMRMKEYACGRKWTKFSASALVGVCVCVCMLIYSNNKRFYIQFKTVCTNFNNEMDLQRSTGTQNHHAYRQEIMQMWLIQWVRKNKMKEERKQRNAEQIQNIYYTWNERRRKKKRETNGIYIDKTKYIYGIH